MPRSAAARWARCIMFFGYFVGVALVGAGIGALAVHLIWSRLGTDPHAFAVILAAVAGAAAAMALQRYVIIVATAFAGAWTMLWAAIDLADRQALPSRAGKCGWSIRSISRPAADGCCRVGGSDCSASSSSCASRRERSSGRGRRRRVRDRRT